MLRKCIFPVFIAMLTLSACKKIDNYDPPNGGVYGRLLDKITNENLQSEQPNGFAVKLFEKGGQVFSPIVFFGKPDGTFENAWVFQNEYKVLPTEGAFFPVDSLTVQVGSRTEANFEVVPFLAVTGATVTAGSGKVMSSYQIARTQVGDKIVERKTLVSKVPTVNNIVFVAKAQTDLGGVDDADILAGSYSDEVTGLSAGTYYVRVAVRTDNALKKYNYSKVFVVTVP